MQLPRRLWTGFGLALLFALPAAAANAQPLPSDDLERECWLKHTRERTRARLAEPTAVDVSNLRDGQVVSSPFRVDFSIRGMTQISPVGDNRKDLVTTFVDGVPYIGNPSAIGSEDLARVEVI